MLGTVEADQTVQPVESQVETISESVAGKLEAIVDQAMVGKPGYEAAKPADAKPVEPAPVAKSSPSFRQETMISARQWGFSEDEIKAFPSEDTLVDAINGRYARRQWQDHQARQPEQPKAEQPPGLAKLEVVIDKDEIGIVGEPIQAIVAHVNKLQEELIATRKQYDTVLRDLAARQQHTADTATSSSARQDAALWDAAVASHPGLANLLGRPSEVMGKPDSKEFKRWAAIANPLMDAVKLAPPSQENYLRALLKAADDMAWNVDQTPLANGNGHSRMPGQVLRSASRKPGAELMVGREAVDQFWQDQFEKAGRNPFSD